MKHGATSLDSCYAVRKSASNAVYNSCLGSQKSFFTGFTLAEVLITLGIIGIVAALTLPALVGNFQKAALKNQYKKTHSMLFNAIKMTQTNLGYPIGCSYWLNVADRPPGCQTLTCTGYNEYGGCNKWQCNEGDTSLGDYNGPRNDCNVFENELFFKTLKTVKHCPNNALANGCITNKYKGTDKVKKEADPDANPNPGADFSDSNIKTKYSAVILADGTLIIKYGSPIGSGSFPVYTVDINGHKGPNKWGHDIFTFALMGTKRDGIVKLNYSTYAIEPGGVSTLQMHQNAFLK